jgi:hypothetical protein
VGARPTRQPLQPEATGAVTEVTKWLNQGSLCNALRTLGERESGTILLEQAVTACRASLDEMKRDWAPFTWAAIQDNLGKTLWALKGPESGSARLEEANHGVGIMFDIGNHFMAAGTGSKGALSD